MKHIFYRGKRACTPDRRFSRALSASVMGMLLCMFCLAGTTWAWFTAMDEASVGGITLGYAQVDATSLMAYTSNEADFIAYGENSAEYLADLTEESVMPVMPAEVTWTKAGNQDANIGLVSGRPMSYTFDVEANTLYRLNTELDTNAAGAWLKIETHEGNYWTRIANDDVECELAFASEGYVVVTAGWGDPEVGEDWYELTDEVMAFSMEPQPFDLTWDNLPTVEQFVKEYGLKTAEQLKAEKDVAIAAALAAEQAAANAAAQQTADQQLTPAQ